MRLVVAAVFGLLACAVSAGAQVAAGEITGIVSDQAGAAVQGATVTVTNVETNRRRVFVSTADGLYTAPSLAPGEYRLEVELMGFKPVRRSGIRLSTGEKARIDFGLAVGEIREQVTVAADASMMRAETASLGTVVEQEQVSQLPLNGRSFITLAALAPGVALPPTSSLPRINGGRPRTNEYLFDGISVLQPEPGQVAFFPIVDAIQEFKIESNSPSAEFGRFNGGVINLTTRAGTNAYHGVGFEFFRNQALNAVNYFQTANTTKPDYRRNQFGGTFGGPVARDRTFFFADYQGQRQAIARTAISSVPTLLQRQGVFSEAIAGRVPVIYDPATTAGSMRQPFANNTIPQNRIDPVALSLLQRYPLPTSPGTANNYRRTENETDDQDQWDARVDHKFATNRDQLFGRLSYFRDELYPCDVPTGRKRRDARWRDWSAENERVVVRLELSACVFHGPVERTACRRHPPRRRTHRRPTQRRGRVDAQHSRHSVECEVPEHAAHISDQRLPAAGFAPQHRHRLQHGRVGSR